MGGATAEQDEPNNPMEGREMDNKREVELLKKAELLMELRGYQGESLHQGEEAIDIKASNTDSDETVLMHIVTKSKLKSDGVGVDKAREAERILGERDVDKIIVFGKRFTSSARKELKEEGIEFFSRRQKIVSSLYPQELYSRILDYVDELCQIKCGRVPESEAECEGFSKGPVKCSYCGGSGITKNSHREYRCPICGGKGSRKGHYSCRVRLISDNADFHFEHLWVKLLQNDLLSLLKILRKSKLELEERPPLPLANGSPITTAVSIKGR